MRKRDEEERGEQNDHTHTHHRAIATGLGVIS